MVVCFADIVGIFDHLILIFTFILKRTRYVQQECKSKNTTVKWNKMKKQKYHTVPNYNIKIVERDKIDTPKTQIHDVAHKYMT